MTLPSGDYILCIDDDKDDCDLLNESIKKIDGNIEAIFLLSADEAMAFLKIAVEKNRLPIIIILDINMPRIDGTELLLKIRNELKLSTPVLFLTTTPRNQDILIGERNGASLMPKPKDLAGYDKIAKTIFKSLIR
jgi:two-component system response regulator